MSPAIQRMDAYDEFLYVHPVANIHNYSSKTDFTQIVTLCCFDQFSFFTTLRLHMTSESVVGRHLGWHYKVYSFAIIQLKEQTQLIHLFLFYFIIALLLWRIIDSFKLPVLISATAAENYLCTVFWKISQDDSDYNLYNSTYFLIAVRLTIFLYNRLYYMHG